MMKRRFLKTLVPILGVSLATAALAASVHLKGNSSPTFTDLGLTLEAEACLAGLGNGDVTILVSASGIPTAVCENKGGNQAPGQNPATVDLGGAITIPGNEIKNGNLCFSLTTLEPDQPTAQEAGCPNGNWEAEITDVDFTTASFLVYQDGQLVFSSGNFFL